MRRAIARGKLILGKSWYSVLEEGQDPNGNPLVIAETATTLGVR